MRTLFAIYNQEVPIFIKYTDTILKSCDLKIGLVYRAFEITDFKRSWSRHLDDYTHTMFCSATDLIKLNIFNPYKKIVKLNDLSGSYIAYNIINSFASQRPDYFDEIVFCCYIDGLEETFIMAPKTSSNALSVALAMRKSGDDESKEKWQKLEEEKIERRKVRQRLLKKGKRGDIFTRGKT